MVMVIALSQRLRHWLIPSAHHVELVDSLTRPLVSSCVITQGIYSSLESTLVKFDFIEELRKSDLGRMNSL